MNSWRAITGYGLALVATNVKAALANRAAFWLQAGLMGINNLIFCTVWLIFFDRYESIGGWQLNHVLAMYGVVAIGFGACMTVTGGVRELAQLISDGDLDTYLAQPKPPVVSAVCHRTFSSGWGDIVSGLLLLGWSGYLAPRYWGIVIVVTVCGGLVFVASSVIVHSMAFFVGRMRELARQWMQFTVTLSVYPQSVFGGALKMLLFTALPAGFMGYLPVELLREFRLSWLLVLMAATAGYVFLALAVFRWGLTRYESGNRIGVRV